MSFLFSQFPFFFLIFVLQQVLLTAIQQFGKKTENTNLAKKHQFGNLCHVFFAFSFSMKKRVSLYMVHTPLCLNAKIACVLYNIGRECKKISSLVSVYGSALNGSEEDKNKLLEHEGFFFFF